MAKDSVISFAKQRASGSGHSSDAWAPTDTMRPRFLTRSNALVRKRGRIVSVGAHASEEWPLPLARCFANEITLCFAIGDSIRLRSRLFALIRSGVLDPTVVVQERLSMDQVLDGYRKLREQQILKAVIDPRH